MRYSLVNGTVEYDQHNCTTFLCRLYQVSGGDTYKRVRVVSKLGEELGLTPQETIQAMLYLSRVEFLQRDRGGVSVHITKSGILDAEAILSKTNPVTISAPESG